MQCAECGYDLRTGAITSSVFWNEVRNVLVVAERRGRLDPEQSHRSLVSLRRFHIAVVESDDAVILSLARTHGVIAHDASYLALAVRLGQPLATLDRKLAQIAMRAGAAAGPFPDRGAHEMTARRPVRTVSP